MSKPTLYGISGSRALRSLWAMEEVGIEFEHVPTTFRDDSKTPEYLAVNPNGKVPALVDGDLTLFESMAINLYVTKTYGGALYPSDPHAEAQALQWSVWGISEIEPLQMTIVVQKFFTPDEKRNDKLVASSGKQLQRPLATLDAHLAEREWLLGSDFTVADLNLAGVMLLMQLVEFDYSNHANVTRWAESCYARPALARARSRE